MSATLYKRIAELESRAAARASSSPAVRELSEAKRHKRDRAAIGALRLLAYECDDHRRREQMLSLEERLALARLDAVPCAEAWGSSAVAARELEIQILERDRRIDDAEARQLSANLHLHEFSSAELIELPFQIVIDEDALAATALRKCPPLATLSLEERLEHEHERERELDRLGLAGLGDGHPTRVADLQKRIRERDGDNLTTANTLTTRTGESKMSKLEQAISAIYDGDAGTAAKLLAEGAAEAIDVTGMASHVREQIARDETEQRALKRMFAQHPEIASDRDLAIMADVHRARWESAGLSRADAIAIAGDEIADKFGTREPNVPVTSQVETSPIESNASAIIAEMARSRGAL